MPIRAYALRSLRKLDDVGDRIASEIIVCRICGSKLKVSRAFHMSMATTVAGTFVLLVASGAGALLLPGLLVPVLGWFGRYQLAEGSEQVGLLPEAKARQLDTGDGDEEC